ncbi:MAG: hypothetical protein RL305_636 [Pseudomonadota bacterium]|jgi:hypothetical protein
MTIIQMMRLNHLTLKKIIAKLNIKFSQINLIKLLMLKKWLIQMKWLSLEKI